VEEQSQKARDLFEKSEFREAAAVLERALEAAPDDSLLTAFLKTFQEAQLRASVESLVRKAHIEASDLIRQKNYPAAIQTLESALAGVGRSVELSALLEVARGNLAELRKQEQQRVQEAVDRARTQAQEHDYAGAVRILERALEEQDSDTVQRLL